MTFVGLELNAFETPNLESPPTNSLPPLRCPLRTGVTGVVSSGVCGGVSSSARPEVSDALNVKAGSVEAVLRCAFATSARGISICIEAEAGRRLGSSKLFERRAAGARGWIGNVKSEFGTMVMTGPAVPLIEAMVFECPEW